MTRQRVAPREERLAKIAPAIEALLGGRQIPSLPGRFATPEGHIFTVLNGVGLLSSPKRLRQHPCARDGYAVVKVDGRERLAHVLVARTFLGPKPDGMETRHLDGTRTNSRLDNLAYGTPVENAHDKARHGRLLYGASGPSSKYTDEQVEMALDAYLEQGSTLAESAALVGCPTSTVSAWASARRQGYATRFKPHGKSPTMTGTDPERLARMRELVS